MQVFLDTSVLISFFRASQSDLKDLERLATATRMQRFSLTISTQVIHEYERFREKAIADALSAFSPDTIRTTFPPFIRDHSKAKDLSSHIRDIKRGLSELSQQLIEEAKARNLIIDEAIQSIFDISSKIEIDFDIQQRALLRAQIGNPPRKRQDGIGDSLNWEAIISGCGASPLCIISSDGDYFSELHENEPKAFLRKEWADTSEGNELIAYKTISSFLSDYGKGIEAGDEHSAEYLVSELEASNSFKRTHELVEALRSAKGLEPKHVERIINAAHYNNQISLIVGDDDIQSFLTDLYEGFAGSIDVRFGEMLYEQLGGEWL